MKSTALGRGIVVTVLGLVVLVGLAGIRVTAEGAMGRPLQTVDRAGSLASVGYDRDRVAAPRVIPDGAGYRMWYDGLNLSAPGQGWAVSLAESADGIAWTKYAANPVLLPGGDGGWDDQVRYQVAVLKDGSSYKMWYSGAAGGPWQVGYATSPDGMRWDVHAGQPVLPVGEAGSWEEFEANGPTVIRHDGLFKMWYHGCDAAYTACGIGYATSTNGYEWLKYGGNPVLLGTPGAWDENQALWPAVLVNGGTFEMWYTSHGQIGRATSPDGIQWSKQPDSPVLGQGWNGALATQPSVLLEDGTYRMWFRNGPPSDSSIGYAESTDGIGWSFPPGNPVLTPTQVRAVYLPLVLKNDTHWAADVIFYNGVVLTMEASPTQAQAVAVHGDRILAVGDDAAILALRVPGTQVVDLEGRALLPGFADGHTHVLRHAAAAGKTLDEAIDLVLSYGLTGVTEMSADNGFVDALLAAESEGRLRLRVNVFPSYNLAWLDEAGHSIYEGAWFPEHGPILDSNRRLRVPGIKIFVDGAGLPPRGCPAMTIPYPAASTDPTFYDRCFDERGDLYLSQEELNQAVADLQGRGFRVAFHAMGDRAIDTVLNAVENPLGSASNGVYRHQIQHSSFLRPDQIERYAALDIVASVRGTWNTCSQEEYRNDWPDHYTQWANRWALPGRGIHAYAEGDFAWRSAPDAPTSVLTLDPLMMLWGLVTREQMRADGTACEPEPWVAQHPISVAQALRMLTIEPAYAVSQENVLGSLKEIKFADVVILSANPLAVDPDELKDLVVLMAMVAGQAEYCRPGYEGLCPSLPRDGGRSGPWGPDGHRRRTTP